MLIIITLADSCNGSEQVQSTPQSEYNACYWQFSKVGKATFKNELLRHAHAQIHRNFMSVLGSISGILQHYMQLKV